ncbi:MAG: hypothetical protein QOD73_2153, partial [Solirubrobacteraceae bacterium]|nr:hypothetical protein [Solirubrobacteraceae bacterium]
DWVNGGGAGNPATALEWADIAALAARTGATPSFHPTAREVTFSYTDESGAPHQVWALDSAAVLERLRMYKANGYGIGVWRHGREDHALWNDPQLAGRAHPATDAEPARQEPGTTRAPGRSP